MKEQPSNPCEKVSFILTYDQLEAAYNIYREQFISCDFIRRSMERLEERIGLCNLPYETLRDDPSLLHERKKVTIKLSIVYKTIVFFKDKFLIFSIDTPSPILSQCILSAYIPPVSFSLSGSVP